MRVGRNTNTAPPANEDADEESPPTNVGRDHSSTSQNDAAVGVNARVRPQLEDEPRQDSTPVIPNAIPVSNDVVIAIPLEPQLPLWKKTKARILFAVVCVVVVVLSIALGVSLSSDNAAVEVVPNTVTSSPSGTPSFSASPSAKLTHVPSSSSAPSFSPTKCAEGITADVQKIGLCDNPSNPKVPWMEGICYRLREIQEYYLLCM